MKNLLKFAALFVLTISSLCEQASAQTTIPVQNASFEQASPTGSWNVGAAPNWTVSGSAGLLAIPSLFSAIPDGTTVAWSNGGTISQNLGISATANTTYTLTVFVGRRTDGLNNTYTISLNAMGSPICSQSGQNNTIPLGTFQVVTLPCPIGATPPAGSLSISLSSAGTQVEFDEVSLTSTPNTPPPPPVSVSLAGTLVWDDTTAIQGDLQIQQQIGTNSFQILADLAPDANGAVSGTVSVDMSQPDPVTFKFILLDTNEKTIGFMQQAVPKAMFSAVHGVNNFKIVISKTNLTLAAGTDPGTLTP